MAGIPGDDDAARWQELGVYDPTAPDAHDQLDLLRFAAASGLAIDEIVARARDGSLARGPVDRVLAVERRLTKASVAVRTGMTAGEIDQLWLAAGFPIAPDDEPAFNDADVEVLTGVRTGVALLGPDRMLQLVRVVGMSMARIAEAAIAAFLVSVEQPMIEAGASPVARATTSVDAAAAMGSLPNLFGPIFRRHAEAFVERQRATQEPGSFDRFRLTVGFADLVGYTAWSSSQSSERLAKALADFDRLAHDRATALGARVVKHIGDAVMFVAPDPATAATVALDLCAAVHAHPLLTELRAAIATGDLLGRDGDYFGPAVNLAARALKEAPPGGLVADAPVRGLTAEDLGTRQLHGIDGPIALYLLRREPGGPERAAVP